MLKTSLKILGVLFLMVVALELRLRFPSATPQLVSSESSVLSIVVLGDSISREMAPGGAYSTHLESLLEKKLGCRKFAVVNKGIPGAETRDLAVQIPEILEQYRPAAVITMIGGGDRIVWPEESWKFKIYSFLRDFRVYRMIQLYASQLALGKKNIPSIATTEAERPISGLKDLEVKFQEFYQTGADNSDYTHNFGVHLRKQKQYILAEQFHKKMLDKFPNHNAAKIELGYLYKETGKFSLSEKYFRSAIERAESTEDKSDDYTWGYIGLSELFDEDLHKPQEAEKILTRVIDRLPKWYFPYLFLVRHFKNIKNEKALEKTLLKGLENCPDEFRLLLVAVEFYRDKGDKELSSKYMTLAERGFANLSTRDQTSKWYRRLSKSITSSGAKHFAMAYPFRPIAAVRDLLAGESDIVYVENRHNFQNAVNSSNYSQYFLDEFGGDFGHFTEKSARLVAENLADEILHEFKGISCSKR